MLLFMGALCSAQGNKSENTDKKSQRWEQIKVEKIGYSTLPLKKLRFSGLFTISMRKYLQQLARISARR